MRLEINNLEPSQHAAVLQWCIDNQLSYEVRDGDTTWIAIHGVTPEQREELSRLKIA